MFINFQTEMEVSYFPEGGSITDYVCDIFGTKVGVSVTRAMKYRGEYTEEDATNLLTKKLKGTYILHKQTQVYFMKCRTLNYDFCHWYRFYFGKGWGGVSLGWDLDFFFTVTINKLHIISDYCEHDMQLIHTKREFFLKTLRGKPSQ